MGEVVLFPKRSEKYWNEVWASLSEQCSQFPEGSSILEGCKVAIRGHWDRTWFSFSVQTQLTPDEAVQAGAAALVQAKAQDVADQIAAQIEQQRAAMFTSIVLLEFRLAYALRHGRDPI